MKQEDLTCKELVELVTEYLEGALDRRERARFEEHVLTCAPCHAYIDQVRSTIEVLGHVPDESLSPAAESELLEAFRGWHR